MKRQNSKIYQKFKKLALPRIQANTKKKTAINLFSFVSKLKSLNIDLNKFKQKSSTSSTNIHKTDRDKNDNKKSLFFQNIINKNKIDSSVNDNSKFLNNDNGDVSEEMKNKKKDLYKKFSDNFSKEEMDKREKIRKYKEFEEKFISIYRIHSSYFHSKNIAQKKHNLSDIMQKDIKKLEERKKAKNISVMSNELKPTVIDINNKKEFRTKIAFHYRYLNNGSKTSRKDSDSGS